MSLSNSESSTKYTDLDQLATSKEFPLHLAIAARNNIAADSINFNSSNSFYSSPEAINFVSRKEIAMNDNDLLKSYMEKVNQDQSDLRSDIRESEKRTTEHLNKVEERMDNRLNRIEDMIKSSAEKSDKNVQDIKDAVDSKMRWVVGSCLATIVGIAAMVVTIIVTLTGAS